MRSIRGRTVRGLLFASLLLPFAAFAQSPEVSERVIRMDQAVQALKDEVVELGREVQSVETTLLTPEHERVAIYLSVDVRGLLVAEVSVAIDDRPAEVFYFDERGARALLAEHTAHRLQYLRAAPGPHRIRVSFVGRYADDKPDAAPTKDSYEAIFDKDHREAELEFTISRARRFGGDARLGMKQWKRRS